MRVRIHRGTREIGGTVVELEAEGQRLLLDCGLPLDAVPDAPVMLPDVPGLGSPDPSLLGVVLSHGHRDHWGLLGHAHGALPVFMGAGTERILAAASFFIRDVPALKADAHLQDGHPLAVGPFTVTPHLVDHSAFDAYALTVEAGGRRLFYSGDIRSHGRKGALFERLITHPPKGIDVMLMEGSSLGRLAEDARFPTETEIEAELTEVIRRTPGMVLVAASAQNIERVVTIFRAAKRNGRTLVVDLYAAEMLHATANSSIPQTSWQQVALFTPWHQRVKVKKAERFDLIERHKAGRLFPEDLAAHPERHVALFRASLLDDLVKAGCLGGAHAVWSQWAGYLKDEKTAALVAALKAQGVGFEIIHTSGHASIPDLKRLAGGIAPRALVPIHTFEADRFPSLFENVVVRRDGEWWEV
ncbi:MBL fold metallo-hydrolase [Xanthobacter sp. V7C-4]|uniref:MBL fold metallo-hydrolase n=1 Tax=Xanthobacter autotrophicus (strain ATCC BAA-1158 / Py2) TaxID=78245 RepID=UPI00372A1DA3